MNRHRAATRMGAGDSLSGFLDRLVRPKLKTPWGYRDVYFILQVLGFCVGVLSVMLVVHLRMLSTWVAAMLCLVTISVVALLHRGGRQWNRHSSFVFWIRSAVYHHQIITLATAILLLLQLGQPLLLYLDAWVMGWLVAQAVGRIGCLMAGCCYGRPHRWGVRYGTRHLEAGYANHLTGIRLFPVQLVEAFLLILLAGVAVLQVLTGASAGDVVSWYFVGYAFVRFNLEFWRGDAQRLYFKGFSEPQWLAVMISLLVVGMQFSGILTFHWWHMLIASVPAAVMATVAIGRSWSPSRFDLALRPIDLGEFVVATKWSYHMASELQENVRGPVCPAVSSTSLGIQISAIRRGEGDHSVFECELSKAGAPMSRREAGRLAELISLVTDLRGPIAMKETTSDGSFHVEVSGGIARRNRRHRGSSSPAHPFGTNTVS